MSLSLLVIAGAAHVRVIGADPVAGGSRCALIAVVGQDVAHMPVFAGAQLQREHAGGFQP